MIKYKKPRWIPILSPTLKEIVAKQNNFDALVFFFFSSATYMLFKLQNYVIRITSTTFSFYNLDALSKKKKKKRSYKMQNMLSFRERSVEN